MDKLETRYARWAITALTTSAVGIQATVFCPWAFATEGRPSPPPVGRAEPRPETREERPSDPAPGPDQSPALTLEAAVERAFANSPAIRAGRAEVARARARLVGAQTYPWNPTVEGGAGARIGVAQTSLDFDVALAQQVEIAGQRGDRIESAEISVAAQEAIFLRKRRVLAGSVHLAFIFALEARELLEIARQDVDLATRLYELAQRRLLRGSTTQLDVNLAAAELGRSEGRFQAARAEYALTRASLAGTIGLEPSALPRPSGALRVQLNPPPPLDALLGSARGNRSDLDALRELERESRARHALAGSLAWPNLTVRAFVGREEGTDTILGGGVSIPIPLFNRNQGSVHETRAGIGRAAAARETGQLLAEREVVGAHARYESSVRTAERLRQLVLGTLEQSLELLQRSFDAGKATWPEVVLIRRTLVDGQRELTSAEARARRTWIELQVAAGNMPIPRITPENPGGLP